MRRGSFPAVVIAVTLAACGGAADEGSAPTDVPATTVPATDPSTTAPDTSVAPTVPPSTTTPSTTEPSATTPVVPTAPDSWIDLGTLPGGEVSAATDINNVGVIVGHSYVGEYEDCGVWWQDWSTGPRRIDELVPLPTGSPVTWATKVNDAGQVLVVAGDGTYVIDVPMGTATEIVPSFGEDGPDGVMFWADDLNEQGQVVGTVTVGWPPEDPAVTGPEPITRGFVWEYATGTMIELGTVPGSGSCAAAAINDRGVIVGTCDGRPVAWDVVTGAVRELALRPGDTWASPLDVNDLGQVVGPGGPWDAATGDVRPDWPNGTEINNVGQVVETQLGINDLGETVGQSAGRATYWPAGWLAPE